MKISAPAFALLALLLGAALALGTAGCKDEIEAKQGAVDEFCAGSADNVCREGLACKDNYCQRLGVMETDQCEMSCDHILSCNADELNCVSNCETTVEYWRADAIDTFTGCLTEQPCDSVGGVDWESVRQACYQKIPLDEVREDTCYRFQASAGECSDADDQTAITQMTKNCLQLARTRPETNPEIPRQSWRNVDSCTGAIDTGVCGEIVNCLNEVFLRGEGSPTISVQ